MKALFSTVILWAWISMSIVHGQVFNSRLDIYTQNLNVYHQGELVAIVSAQKIHDIKEDDRWRKLLTSFNKNLESIKDQIPEYLIYKIDYKKDYNLIVEEVEGVVRYKVNEGQTTFDAHQSKAILSAQDFEIQINFGGLNDLFENNYEEMIESAMLSLGKKHRRFKRYNYSYSKKEMIEQKTKNKIKFVIPINGTIGVFRGRPIYEQHGGLGISIKKQNEERNQLLYVFFGTLYQYEEEIEAMKNSALVGAAWKTKRGESVSVAFPIEPNSVQVASITNDILLRIGYTVHTRNFLAVTTNFYYKKNGDFIPSLAFGFSF